MTTYFKGLDSIRAIAALVVVFGHIEALKKYYLIPNLIDNKFIIFPSAHLSVVLFFVLSGFLITYLLYKEKEKTGTFSFRKFYMRRILRIWPLYYLIITLSYLLINYNYTFKTVALCMSIFPNLAVALKSGWPSSPQIWSIGVEEQFYLFWPLFLSILPDKKVIKSMVLFFIFFSIFPSLFAFTNKRTFQNLEIQRIIHTLFNLTKYNCMAVGSIMGYALAKQKAWINKLSKDSIALFFLFISFFLWFFNCEVKYFNDEFYAIIFSLMIVGIVNANKINIDTKISRFLGKISYGIYMYHWMIILFVLKYYKYNDNQLYFNCILYSTVFLATIVVSWISHITIEKYFLNLKNRFKTY